MVGRALDVAAVRWVGRRPYGIYLWHWPVFVVTRPVLDVSLGAGAMLAPRLAITVAIAALSYRYLEQPIRREGFTPWLKRVTAHGLPSSRARGPRSCSSERCSCVLLAFGLVRGPLVGTSGQEQARASTAGRARQPSSRPMLPNEPCHRGARRQAPGSDHGGRAARNPAAASPVAEAPRHRDRRLGARRAPTRRCARCSRS